MERGLNSTNLYRSREYWTEPNKAGRFSKGTSYDVSSVWCLAFNCRLGAVRLMQAVIHSQSFKKKKTYWDKKKAYVQYKKIQVESYFIEEFIA